jgi:hypothetical protein
MSEFDLPHVGASMTTSDILCRHVESMHRHAKMDMRKLTTAGKKAAQRAQETRIGKHRARIAQIRRHMQNQVALAGYMRVPTVITSGTSDEMMARKKDIDGMCQALVNAMRIEYELCLEALRPYLQKTIVASKRQYQEYVVQQELELAEKGNAETYGK